MPAKPHKGTRMKPNSIALLTLGVSLLALSANGQDRLTREEYIQKYKSLAVEEMEVYGIPASITMAQALLESDNGNGRLAREGNNHFGIKCKSTWTGATISHDDDAKGECFRKYPSVEASFNEETKEIEKPGLDYVAALHAADENSLLVDAGDFSQGTLFANMAHGLSVVEVMNAAGYDLGVLGNHDDSGLAQLSDPAARDFAAELAAYCETYGLDGVCFDDEYSNVNPDTSNPLFTRPSMAAAARLLYETKKAMPHKTVMVYYLGNITPYIPAVDGVDPGYFVDVAVADYSSINPGATPMTGMPLKNCAGASIELNLLKGDWTTETARKQKAAGYGHYMFFSLNPDNYAWRGQVTMVRSVASGLYDETLDQVTHYYKKGNRYVHITPAHL